jgi:small conductance mechanosensitive channel
VNEAGFDTLSVTIQEQWASLAGLLPKIAAALVVLLVLTLVGRAVGSAVERLLARGRLSPAHQGFFRNLTRWLFAALGLAIALNILGLQGALRGFLAGGGLTAVIVGFAFRDIGENFLAGFLLAFDRHFDVGDLVQSGEFMGTVKEIALRSTHIRTADGRDIFIPSAQIFGNPLVNYTRDGLRRPSFTVGIDYGDDAEKARRLLLETIRTVPGVLLSPEPTVFVGELTAQYVQLEATLWINTFDSSSVLPLVVSTAMDRCRRTLLDNGFTVSSSTTSNLELKGCVPLEVKQGNGQD